MGFPAPFILIPLTHWYAHFVSTSHGCESGDFSLSNPFFSEVAARSPITGTRERSSLFLFLLCTQEPCCQIGLFHLIVWCNILHKRCTQKFHEDVILSLYLASESTSLKFQSDAIPKHFHIKEFIYQTKRYFLLDVRNWVNRTQGRQKGNELQFTICNQIWRSGRISPINYQRPGDGPNCCLVIVTDCLLQNETALSSSTKIWKWHYSLCWLRLCLHTDKKKVIKVLRTTIYPQRITWRDWLQICSLVRTGLPFKVDGE